MPNALERAGAYHDSPVPKVAVLPPETDPAGPPPSVLRDRPSATRTTSAESSQTLRPPPVSPSPRRTRPSDEGFENVELTDTKGKGKGKGKADDP